MTKSLQLALLLSLAATPASAQAGPPDFSGRLGPSAVIRATLADGRTVTGRYAPLGAGTIGIVSETGVTDTLTIARLESVAVRGRQTRTGALVGGVAGVAAGIFFGYVIGALCDAADCDRGKPYLVTIPLFGGGGTLLGAAIGAAIPKWKQVFP